MYGRVTNVTPYIGSKERPKKQLSNDFTAMYVVYRMYRTTELQHLSLTEPGVKLGMQSRLQRSRGDNASRN